MGFLPEKLVPDIFHTTMPGGVRHFARRWTEGYRGTVGCFTEGTRLGKPIGE